MFFEGFVSVTSPDLLPIYRVKLKLVKKRVS